MVIKKVCSGEITAFCCCPRGWSVHIYPCWLVGSERGDLIRPGGELLSRFVVLGNDQEEKCRSFIELTPGETQGRREKYGKTQKADLSAPSKLFSCPLSGVLWLSVISEFMYIGLLAMGFLLMWVEAICLCAKREMNALKINAFAAMCTVLSGRGEGLQKRIPLALIRQ